MPETALMKRASISNALLLPLVFIGLTFCDAGSLNASKVGSQQPLNQLQARYWQNLYPRIQLFWKELESSPVTAQKTAWTLIKALKRYVQLYPNAPHAAEAYSTLGEAYAAVSFIPEALAHWRIVARHYPKSPWASQALMSIVLYLERQGDTRGIRRLYQEIVRQFPDSAAAKAAWVIMAINALKAGKVDQVAEKVRLLEERAPDIHIQVPDFLDLKARLAAAQGKEKEARGYWLHYLNLIRSPAQRAATFFRIAESYRRQGLPLRAEKYYAILKRDFPNQPESLFARFRLAQMQHNAKSLLTRYIPGLVPPGYSSKTEALYQEIINRYPHHPITQEVQLELIRLSLQNDRPIKALELSFKFLGENSDSPYAPTVRQLGQKALKLLGLTALELKEFKETVAFLTKALDQYSKKPLIPGLEEATQGLWLSYVVALFKHQRFKQALMQAWELQERYPDTQVFEKAKGLAERSLLALDRDILARGAPLELVNFHYEHKKPIEQMAISNHYFYLGKAWAECLCYRAAMRAFYKAFLLDSVDQKTDNDELLLTWAQSALEVDDIESASLVLDLYGSQDNRWAATLFARLFFKQGRWQDAKAGFEKAFSFYGNKGPPIPLRVLYFKTLVMLSKWNSVRKLWPELSEKIDLETKAELLSMWGDCALELLEYTEALYAYNMLVALSPDSPEYQWRLAITHLRSGQSSMALEELKAMTQEKKQPWATAAKLLLSNEEFWRGPAGEVL